MHGSSLEQWSTLDTPRLFLTIANFDLFEAMAAINEANLTWWPRASPRLNTTTSIFKDNSTGMAGKLASQERGACGRYIGRGLGRPGEDARKDWSWCDFRGMETEHSRRGYAGAEELAEKVFRRIRR